MFWDHLGGNYAFAQGEQAVTYFWIHFGWSTKGAGGAGRTTVSEVIKPRICGEAYLPQSPAGESHTHCLSCCLASWTRAEAKALEFWILILLYSDVRR